MHQPSAAERLRAMLLQALMVGLVVVAGLLVFDTVADATSEVGNQMDAGGATTP